MISSSRRKDAMTTITLICMGLTKALLLWILVTPQTQTPTPMAQPQLPPCAASTPAPTKKAGWAERMKQHLAQMAQRELDRAGNQIGTATGGAVDGSTLLQCRTLPETGRQKPSLALRRLRQPRHIHRPQPLHLVRQLRRSNIKAQRGRGHKTASPNEKGNCNVNNTATVGIQARRRYRRPGSMGRQGHEHCR